MELSDNMLSLFNLTMNGSSFGGFNFNSSSGGFVFDPEELLKLTAKKSG